MNRIHLLIKPASGLCNMRCGYCFYADEMNKREQPSKGMMTLDTLEALVKRVYGEVPDHCVFAFQGGEPTLAGLPFFEAFMALVERYNPGGSIPTEFALQTNGYAVDEDWAAFFARHGFLIGLSLDGYQDLHDLYRVDASKNGTYKRVMKAAGLLDKHGVPFNLLTVVTAQTAKHIGKVYRFFEKSGFGYQQYIPCLDPMDEERGQRQYSLTPERYEQFLKSLFDLWYADLARGKHPYNRYFENLVGMLAGQAPEACGMLGHCTRQFVIEADGTVYPCDFYAVDLYCIGNIAEDGFARIEENREKTGFLKESLPVAEDCEGCKWYPLCRGGCRRDRDYGGRLQKNYFCKAYDGFFEYAYPRLERLAQSLAYHSQG